VFRAATYIVGSTVGNDNHRGHERKVSKSVALAVIVKLKSGKTSVHREALRLGVYHATLRKEMRAAVGSKQYDKLLLRRKGLPAPALSKSRVLSVIAKIKAGKSSINTERQRLRVGEGRLRNLIRATMGSIEYAKLVERKRKMVTKPKAATPAPMEADRFPSGRKRSPKQTPPTFSQVAGDFCCGQCGSPRVKAGTDGIGQAVLWCVCGWIRAIPRVRATAATVG
jgi:hypothetical protein